MNRELLTLIFNIYYRAYLVGLIETLLVVISYYSLFIKY